MWRTILSMFLAIIAAAISDPVAAADAVLSTCAQHGPNMMTLQFVREAGPARTIAIIGGSVNTKWTVKIDTMDVTPPTQTAASPGQVKVHPGDKITWKVEALTHGLLFPTKADAEKLFEFDSTQGKPLDDRTGFPGFKWGTEKFMMGTTLAVATVKSSDTLLSTCAQHGPNMMTLQFIREAGPARTIAIIGGSVNTKWTVKIDTMDVTPPTQTAAIPGQVKVHPGDKITWKVEALTHGLLFPTKADAEKLFEFDSTQGKPLDDRTGFPGFKWGTEKFMMGTTLAVATVKSSDTLLSTCAQHGPNMMTLQFIREAGPARTIAIIGGSVNTKWTVKIDTMDVTPSTQTAAIPGQVKVHPGDKITWKVEALTHGLLFPTKADAEKLFEFDSTQGKPLDDRTGFPGFKWGTEKFMMGTTLAVATVK